MYYFNWAVTNTNFDILHTEGRCLKLNLWEALDITKFVTSNNLHDEYIDIDHSLLLNMFYNPYNVIIRNNFTLTSHIYI